MQHTEQPYPVQSPAADTAGTPALCFFTDSLDPSGVGEHMLTLAAELHPLYRVSLVCPPTPPGETLLARARALNLTTLALEARGAWTEEHLAAWLRTERIDLFHVHAGIGWEGHHGIYAARLAGVRRIVRTEHLPDLLTDPKQRADYLRVICAVDRVICVSEGVRSSFQRAGVPVEKLRIVRNGIDRPTPPAPGLEERRALRLRLKLPPDARVILGAGRLTEQKGARFLIEAVPSVVRCQPNTHFIWAGDGPLKDELRQRAQRRGITGYLEFLGQRSDLAALMAAADLLVLPSLFEGLPLVVLEAMASSLPVVGTRVCGTDEAVRDGVTGRLVEAGNAKALANAILEVLDQPQLAARWGDAGRQRFEREFQPPRMARETAAVYQELLGRHASCANLIQ